MYALEKLIEAGSDVNIRDIYGDVPLLAAADQGSVRIVEKLISAGANVQILNNDGSTPLNYASSSYGSAELAKILIRSGVDVIAINVYGLTALNYALLNDAEEAADLIRKHGGQDVSLQHDTYWRAIPADKEIIWSHRRFGWARKTSQNPNRRMC